VVEDSAESCLNQLAKNAHSFRKQEKKSSKGIMAVATGWSFAERKGGSQTGSKQQGVALN
jgi:hypothetical protein